MRRAISVGILVAACAAAAGCATVINGTSQQLAVTSEPPGADVIIEPMGTRHRTPAVVSVPRSSTSVSVRLEKDGFEQERIGLTRTVDGWLAGNLISWLLPGVFVDLVTGGGYQQNPSEIRVRLRPHPGYGSVTQEGTGTPGTPPPLRTQPTIPDQQVEATSSHMLPSQLLLERRTAAILAGEFASEITDISLQVSRDAYNSAESKTELSVERSLLLSELDAFANGSVPRDDYNERAQALLALITSKEAAPSSASQDDELQHTSSSPLQSLPSGTIFLYPDARSGISNIDVDAMATPQPAVSAIRSKIEVTAQYWTKADLDRRFNDGHQVSPFFYEASWDQRDHVQVFWLSVHNNRSPTQPIIRFDDIRAVDDLGFEYKPLTQSDNYRRLLGKVILTPSVERGQDTVVPLLFETKVGERSTVRRGQTIEGFIAFQAIQPNATRLRLNVSFKLKPTSSKLGRALSKPRSADFAIPFRVDVRETTD